MRPDNTLELDTRIAVEWFWILIEKAREFKPVFITQSWPQLKAGFELQMYLMLEFTTKVEFTHEKKEAVAAEQGHQVTVEKTSRKQQNVKALH